MNTAFESFDLGNFDLVVSSNHSCAKNVMTTPDTLHVCYCHTPMRHAWDPRFLDTEKLDPLTRRVLPLLLVRLRREDLAGSLRPDHYVANSTAVAARIAKYYRRDARVIHPPSRWTRCWRRPGPLPITTSCSGSSSRTSEWTWRCPPAGAWGCR